MNDEHVVVLLDEAASEYVWGVKNPGRVANQYLRRYGMKIKRSKLEKMIMEEARKLLREQAITAYERSLDRTQGSVSSRPVGAQCAGRHAGAFRAGSAPRELLDAFNALPPWAKDLAWNRGDPRGPRLRFQGTQEEGERAMRSFIQTATRAEQIASEGGAPPAVDLTAGGTDDSGGSSSGGGGGGSARGGTTGLEQKAGQHAAATAAAPLEFRGATGQFTPWAIGPGQLDPASIAGDHNKDGIIDLRDIDAALSAPTAAPGTLRYQELMDLASQMGYRRDRDRGDWAETEYAHGQTRADQPSWRALSAQAKGIPGFYGVTGTEPPTSTQRQAADFAQRYTAGGPPLGQGHFASQLRAPATYGQLRAPAEPSSPASPQASGGYRTTPTGGTGVGDLSTYGARTDAVRRQPATRGAETGAAGSSERPANYDPEQGELQGIWSEGVNRRIERMIEREINKVYGKLR